MSDNTAGDAMLTTNLIAALASKDKRYQVPDKDGLFLRVTPAGKKSFFYEYRSQGGKLSGTLGEWPAMSLDDARAAFAKIKERDNPIAGVTFGQAFASWLEMKRPTVTPDCIFNIERRAIRYVLPTFKNTPLLEITAPAMIKALQPLYDADKKETLARCIIIVNQVLDWCVNGGLMPHNPCIRIGKFFLARAEKKPRPSISAKELPELLRLVYTAKRLTIQSQLYFYWSVCSMLRPGENAALEWAWIKGDVLTLPAAAMKMRKEHRVPLTPFMLKILAEQKRVCDLTTPGTSFIWPSETKSGHISPESANKFLRENGYRDRLVMHGLRSMARSWMAEQGIDRDIAEACLAHQDKNRVVVVYQRYDFLKQRRLAMEQWTDYVERCLEKAKAA